VYSALLSVGDSFRLFRVLLRHGVGCIHDLVQQSQKQDTPGPGQYDVDAVRGGSRSERHSNSPPLSCGDRSLRDGHFAHD
jgi:hypothetical protein